MHVLFIFVFFKYFSRFSVYFFFRAVCFFRTMASVVDVPLINTGLEIYKNVWSQFATSYENLVATMKILVAKLIKAIQLRNKWS